MPRVKPGTEGLNPDNWRKVAEDAIVNRLLPLVPLGCAIENRPSERAPKMRVKAQIFYEEGPVASTVETPSGLTQRRLATYRVNVRMVEIRTHQGIYEFLDKIESMLNGFYPLDPSRSGPLRLAPDGDSYQQPDPKDTGEWFYTMLFQFELNTVQQENFV
ncbi:MAG: Gp37 family protein [Cyanobacteria bacterium J06638_22]